METTMSQQSQHILAPWFDQQVDAMNDQLASTDLSISHNEDETVVGGLNVDTVQNNGICLSKYF